MVRIDRDFRRPPEPPNYLPWVLCPILGGMLGCVGGGLFGCLGGVMLNQSNPFSLGMLIAGLLLGALLGALAGAGVAALISAGTSRGPRDRDERFEDEDDFGAFDDYEDEDEPPRRFRR
jgi:hypothetical protein